MKVYHFIDEEYGLQALENQCLKVSKMDNLNDPFELLSVDFAKKKIRPTFRKIKRRFSSKYGILCFSKTRKDPILWSHYADRHYGLAIELEANEEKLIHVTYQKNRKKIPDEIFNDEWPEDFAIELLSTKYEGWEYEKEARFMVQLNLMEEKEDMHFYQFNSDLYPTRIIKGPLSNLGKSEIRNHLPEGNEIELMHSRLAFQSFEVVKDLRYGIEKLNGNA